MFIQISFLGSTFSSGILPTMHSIFTDKHKYIYIYILTSNCGIWLKSRSARANKCNHLGCILFGLRQNESTRKPEARCVLLVDIPIPGWMEYYSGHSAPEGEMNRNILKTIRKSRISKKKSVLFAKYMSPRCSFDSTSNMGIFSFIKWRRGFLLRSKPLVESIRHSSECHTENTSLRPIFSLSLIGT